MSRKVIVDLNILNSIFSYLSERPYKDVVNLIDMLKNSIEEIPKNEESEK
jgi:hypothetical protein